MTCLLDNSKSDILRGQFLAVLVQKVFLWVIPELWLIFLICVVMANPPVEWGKGRRALTNLVGVMRVALAGSFSASQFGLDLVAFSEGYPRRALANLVGCDESGLGGEFFSL